MSNYLAIATVTAALQRLLQTGIQDDVPGATVTTIRPDNAGATNQSVGINIYLYQATPNPAWRNADLRTRRPKGDLIKHGQAGLDLHYLLTFYGNEQELEPQRLLGSAVRILVDQPTLTQDLIQETIDQSNLPYLADSTLGDQVQLVQFIPSTLTTDELSRIWSVFFQIPYSLSFVYQGTAVLIQGERPGKMALPVRRREFYLSSTRPVIDKIKLEKPKAQDSPFELVEEIASTEFDRLTRSSNLVLVIQGRRLKSERVRVRIGRVEVTPQDVTDGEVKVQLSHINAQESALLKAGVQGVQVIHPFSSQPGADYDVESNVMPLVLCPQIAADGNGIVISELDEQDEANYNATATINVDVTVTPEQRVFLLLNAVETSKTYIFRAIRRSEPSTAIAFAIHNVAAGPYIARIQIDGAESPMTVDANDQYSGPRVVIP